VRAIFLHGHQPTVTAAYMHVDALLRKLEVRDIVLAIVAAVDEHTAQTLRQSGGELWLCAPEPAQDQPAAPACTVRSDRELLAASWHELTTKAANALADFLGLPGVPT
jgi:hypothetical protein